MAKSSERMRFTPGCTRKGIGTIDRDFLDQLFTMARTGDVPVDDEGGTAKSERSVEARLTGINFARQMLTLADEAQWQQIACAPQELEEIQRRAREFGMVVFQLLVAGAIKEGGGEVLESDVVQSKVVTTRSET